MLSQHIGDLDTVETFDYYQRAIRHFQALSRKTPGILAYDLHPGYLSSRYALGRTDLELVGVQHHHAHIAACLAENGRTGKCLGVALDGTGYGPDGTVWGGELLVADLASCTRAGHSDSGADARRRGGHPHPGRWRRPYLLALYRDDWEKMASRLGLTFSDLERQLLARQLATGWHAPADLQRRPPLRRGGRGPGRLPGAHL